jgi:2-C-methyl-D-erythritol 4-phosphate cytidylyltransferase
MNSSSDPACTFVIPAAGAGTRFGASMPKQYVELDDAPVLVHTLRRCLALPGVQRAIVAVAVDQREAFSELMTRFNLSQVESVVGGSSRQESVYNALLELELEADALVAVHDAVRPFFSPSLYEHLIAATQESGAAVPLLPLSDTLHRHHGGLLTETPDRSEWGLAQTPQCFRFGILFAAMKRAQEEGVSGTDEGGVVARYGHAVRVVGGESGNFKITHPNDLARAEGVVRGRAESES